MYVFECVFVGIRAHYFFHTRSHCSSTLCLAMAPSDRPHPAQPQRTRLLLITTPIFEVFQALFEPLSFFIEA